MVLDLVLRVKPARLLVCLKNEEHEWHVSWLAKESGMTYVYATRILKDFERAGLVLFERKGKLKLVRLTDKGLKIANCLEDLVQKLSQKTGEPAGSGSSSEGVAVKQVPVIKVKRKKRGVFKKQTKKEDGVSA